MQILQKKLPSGCGCAARSFFVFFVLLVFVRAFVIPSWEDWSSDQDRRRDAYLMASLAAFINHERQLNGEETFQELFQKAQKSLEASWIKDKVKAASIDWGKIELQELPLAKQKNLRRIEYVLINKSSDLMMLGDGRLIYPSYSLERVAEMYPYTDPTRSLW